jgi:hypothetical protein
MFQDTLDVSQAIYDSLGGANGYSNGFTWGACGKLTDTGIDVRSPEGLAYIQLMKPKKCSYQVLGPEYHQDNVKLNEMAALNASTEL